MTGHAPKWGTTFDVLRDILMFDLRPFMDLYERETMSFIFSRTCMFGKAWEAIPLRHFIEGIPRPDGGFVAAPVCMSETNLLRSLKLLEDKHILDVRRYPRPRASEYRIRSISELSIDHIAQIMQREQPKQFQSMHDRMFKVRDAGSQRGRMVDVVQRNTCNTLPQIQGNDYPKFGGGDYPKFGGENIPIVNNPISNIAAQPHVRTRFIKPRRT